MPGLSLPGCPSRGASRAGAVPSWVVPPWVSAVSLPSAGSVPSRDVPAGVSLPSARAPPGAVPYRGVPSRVPAVSLPSAGAAPGAPNFPSRSVRAPLRGKAISVQTREASEGLALWKASPGAAESGTVLLFPLGFYCEWIAKTKAVSQPFFLSCLIYKISAVCEPGLCRIHSSEGNLAHILQYHPPSAVDVL